MVIIISFLNKKINPYYKFRSLNLDVLTEYFLQETTEELARFNAIPLTEAERQQVLWQNADRLFGLGLM